MCSKKKIRFLQKWLKFLLAQLESGLEFKIKSVGEKEKEKKKRAAHAEICESRWKEYFRLLKPDEHFGFTWEQPETNVILWAGLLLNQELHSFLALVFGLETPKWYFWSSTCYILHSVPELFLAATWCWAAGVCFLSAPTRCETTAECSCRRRWCCFSLCFHIWEKNIYISGLKGNEDLPVTCYIGSGTKMQNFWLNK